MAVREIKTALTLDGEKQFKAELDAAYRSMKTLGSELKLNSARYSENANGMAALTKKSAILKNEIAQQKEIVKTLEKAVESAADAYGDADKRTDEYRTKLNNAKASLVSMENELTETSKKTTGLGAVFTTVKEKTEKWNKSLRTVSEGLGTAIGALTKATAGVTAVGAAAVAAGKQVFDLATENGKLADSLLTTSTQTGVSVKTLQEWSYASQFIDTDVDTMTGAMAKMVNQLDSVSTGSGDTAKAFKKLHVSIKEGGQLKDSETIFLELIDALGNVKNETQRDALAMQIFGKSAQDLNPLIEAGSAGLTKYGQEAQNAGVILSDDAVAAFGAFDDQMNVVNSTVTGIKQNFITALLPALEQIVPIVQQAATSFNAWLQSAAGQSVIAGLGEKIANLAANFGENLGPAIDKTISAFTKIIDAVGWVIDNFDGLVAAGAALIATLTALKAAQIAVNIAMAAGTALSGGTVLIIGAIAAALVLLIANWDKVSAAMQAAFSWIGQAASDIGSFVAGIGQSIAGGVTSALQWFQNGTAQTSAYFQNMQAEIGTTVSGLWSSIVSGASGLWDSIMGGFASLGQSIQNIFSGVGTFFSNLWSNILSSFSNMWTSFVNIGSSIVQGIWQGIQAAGSWLHDKLFGWVDDVVGWAQDLLGIHSPSAVMRDKIGKPMAQGVAEGMRRNMGLVKSAIRSLTPDTQTVSVMMDVNRRFSSVAESTLTRTRTAAATAEPADETNRAGTARSGKAGVTVNQYIYANETSYAEQQRLAASRMREVVWGLS